MVRAGADFSQLSQAMQRAQGEATTFGSHFESIFTRIGFVGNGLKIVFEGIVHAVEGMGEFAKEAGELDGRLSSLNNRLGASAQAFQDWSNANGQTLGLSKKDMIEQGASISAMLETSISDKQKLTQETEQMLKNIAIVSSATGKSQQEVSERMVSALQGHSAAVSSLDLNMHLSSLRMTQAYKEIAGSSPWAKLTAEQQQMIIVSALNEQVQTRFGNKVVEDVATRMNRFTASLSNVKTSLEQAFQPILFRVLPILTTFINYINTALQYVTAFFQVLFGYSGAVQNVTGDLNDQKDAVNGLSSAYDNLGSAIGKSKGSGVKVPKVKKPASGTGAETVSGGKKSGTGFLASFDQVHTLPEKSDSSSGSGSGAGSPGAVGAGGVPDIGGGIATGAKKGTSALSEIQGKVKEFIDKVKAFLAPFVPFFMEIWKAVSSYFKQVIDQMTAWWGKYGGQIVQALKNAWAIMGPIITFIAKFLWDSIKGAINGIITFFEGLTEFLTGIFTGNWKLIFQGLWDMIRGGLQAVWNIFNIVFIFDGVGMIKGFAEKGLKYILDFFLHSGKGAQDFVGNIGRWFVDCVKGIKNILNDLELFWYRVFDGMLHKGVDMWNGLIDGARTAWGWIQNVFYDAVGWFTRIVITPIINAFNDVLSGFSDGGLIGGLKAIINTYIDYLDSFIDMLNGVINVIPGMSFSIPDIPHLARGGITNGPMMAVIGDNAGGQEVVTPLDRLQGMMANTVAQTVQTVMAMQGGSKKQGMQSITLNVDGKTFARVMKPYLDNETLRVGQNVRLNTI
jgi:phage-related protein